MKITIYGAGYVGLVTGICFAELGNDVLCVDIDEAKVQQLRQGIVPFYEPQLSELLEKNLAKHSIGFTTDSGAGVAFSEVQLICVGTPANVDGTANLDYVFSVVQAIAGHAEQSLTIIIKSTVPIGTADKVDTLMGRLLQDRGAVLNFTVVSNPEFLRQGLAVHDFMQPDRVVVGSDVPAAIHLMHTLYHSVCTNERPLLVMKRRSAELAKYAANIMLASRVSLMNELANLADRVGADIRQVQASMTYDPRIGDKFLSAGCGYGGSCLPKDVKALIHIAREENYVPSLLQAIDQVNQQQHNVLFNKIRNYFSDQLEGRTLAIWGLAFKPGTDDIREAPSITLIRQLLAAGCSIKAYDPQAGQYVREFFANHTGLTVSETAMECTMDADGLVVVTEWSEFAYPDFSYLKTQLKQPVIFDGRNVYTEEQLQAFGLQLIGIGYSSDTKIQS